MDDDSGSIARLRVVLLLSAVRPCHSIVYNRLLSFLCDENILYRDGSDDIYCSRSDNDVKYHMYIYNR